MAQSRGINGDDQDGTLHGELQGLSRTPVVEPQWQSATKMGFTKGWLSCLTLSSLRISPKCMIVKYHRLWYLHCAPSPERSILDSADILSYYTTTSALFEREMDLVPA